MSRISYSKANHQPFSTIRKSLALSECEAYGALQRPIITNVAELVKLSSASGDLSLKLLMLKACHSESVLGLQKHE